jgi:hypothetical protein
MSVLKMSRKYFGKCCTYARSLSWLTLMTLKTLKLIDTALGN